MGCHIFSESYNFSATFFLQLFSTFSNFFFKLFKKESKMFVTFLLQLSLNFFSTFCSTFSIFPQLFLKIFSTFFQFIFKYFPTYFQLFFNCFPTFSFFSSFFVKLVFNFFLLFVFNFEVVKSRPYLKSKVSGWVGRQGTQLQVVELPQAGPHLLELLRANICLVTTSHCTVLPRIAMHSWVMMLTHANQQWPL